MPQTWDAIRLQERVTDLVLVGGTPVSEVNKSLEALDLGTSTISEWVRFRALWGFVPARKKPERGRPGAPLAHGGMSAENREALRRIVVAHPHWYMPRYVREFHRVTGSKHISASVIYKTVTGTGPSQLNFSYQVLQKMARQRNEVLAAEWRDHIRTFDDPSVFLWIDETSRGRQAAAFYRGYLPRGSGGKIKMVFDTTGGIQYTMLAAADCHGFIAGACEVVRRRTGDNDPNEAHGNVDASVFLDYVEDCVVPHLGNFVRGEPRSVVILDNASPHDESRLRRLVEGAGAILIFLPPYCPHLNPIEPCFLTYKRCLRDIMLRYPSTYWFDAHQEALSSVSRQTMSGYMRKSSCYPAMHIPTPPAAEVIIPLCLAIMEECI